MFFTAGILFCVLSSIFQLFWNDLLMFLVFFIVIIFCFFGYTITYSFFVGFQTEEENLWVLGYKCGFAWESGFAIKVSVKLF